jgi:hypothetical protein
MAGQRRFNCSPEQVFAVLRDGWTYPVPLADLGEGRTWVSAQHLARRSQTSGVKRSAAEGSVCG